MTLGLIGAPVALCADVVLSWDDEAGAAIAADSRDSRMVCLASILRVFRSRLRLLVGVIAREVSVIK